MDVQGLAVLVVVALAALFLAARVWRSVSRTQGAAGCHGCDGCAVSSRACSSAAARAGETGRRLDADKRPVVPSRLSSTRG